MNKVEKRAPKRLLIEIRKPRKIMKPKKTHKKRFPTLNDLFFMASKK